MRPLAIFCGLLLLGVAGTAQAASTSLVWTSSGTNVLSATATGPQQLDLFLHLATGEVATGFQFSVDLGGTTFVDGTCNNGIAEFNVPCPAGQPQDAPLGQVDLAGFWSGSTLFVTVNGPGTFDLGTLTVSGYAAGTSLELGILSLNDAAFSTGGGSLPVIHGTAIVVPEPGAFALMGLGSGALAFARRRR